MAESKISILLEFLGQQAVEAANSAARGIQGAMGSMQNATVSFGTTLKNLVRDSQLASAEFTGAFTLIGKQAVDTAAEFEKTGIMANYLTKNKTEADKFSQSLIDLALHSSFTTKEITSLGVRLQSQFKDADLTKRAMDALTNSVSALGGDTSDLNNAGKALIQTYVKAKPSLEELNRQFSNSVPVLRVLAEHLADGSVKLKGYTDAVTTTGGATKAQAKAFASASEKLPILKMQLDKTKAGLDSYNKSSKKSTEATLSHQIAVLKAQQAYDKAQGSIGTYNTAVANTSRSVIPFHKSAEQIMSDLQGISDLGVTGKDTAIAIMEALSLEYAGANDKVLNSFWGLSRNIKDQIEVLESSILGIDKTLGVREGSIFFYLKKGAQGLSDFLSAHRYDIANFVDGLLRNKDALIGIAAVITTLLIPALTWLLGPWISMAGLLVVLAPAFFLVGEAIKSVVKEAGGFGAVMDNIKNFFGLVDDNKNTFKSMGTEMERVKFVTDNLNQSLVPGTEAWKKHQQAIKTDVVPAYVDMNGKLRNMTGLMTTDLPNGIMSTVTRTENLGKTLEEVNAKKLSPFQKMLQEVKDLTLPLMNAAIKDLKESFINLNGSIDLDVWDLFKSLLTGTVLILREVVGLFSLGILGIRGFFEAIQLGYAVLTGNNDAIIQHDNNIQKLWQSMQNVATSMANIATPIQTANQNIVNSTMNMSTQTGAALMSVQTNVANMTNSVNTNLSTLPVSGITNSTAMMNSIQTTIDTQKPLVDTSINNVTNSIDSSMSVLPGNATAHANNVSTNMINSFNTNKPLVEKSIKSIMNSVDSSMAATANAATGHGESTIRNFVNGIISMAKSVAKAGVFGPLGQVAPVLFDIAKMAFFQHGGTIPGPIGTPVPIIAHGGERIVPTTGADVNAERGTEMGFSITINMNGDVMMDSSARIKELAGQIVRILGRQNELSRYGVGF